MAVLPELIETERWREMKALKARGLRFSEMVPILHAAGLVSCPNCDDPAKARTNQRGETICTTCENTIYREWTRKLSLLKDDEPDLMEVKWAYIEALEFVARVCRERYAQKVKVRTTQGAEEEREDRVLPELLRLHIEAKEKIAKVLGLDIEDPIPDGEEVKRGKVHVNRPASGAGADAVN